MKLNDWRGRLNDTDNIMPLAEISKDWCVCGIGDRIFEETGMRATSQNNVRKCISEEASSLGYNFHQMVCEGNKEKALDYLKQIEDLETVF